MIINNTYSDHLNYRYNDVFGVLLNRGGETHCLFVI